MHKFKQYQDEILQFQDDIMQNQEEIKQNLDEDNQKFKELNNNILTFMAQFNFNSQHTPTTQYNSTTSTSRISSDHASRSCRHDNKKKNDKNYSTDMLSKTSNKIISHDASPNTENMTSAYGDHGEYKKYFSE
jgi:hypothetical protein